VLEWGETPPDLDAHLTGPDGSGDRFHVTYFRKEPSGVDVRLEEDVSDGVGPETVTVTDIEDGIYRYSVHNFSDRSRDGASGIASSAEVTAYGSDGQIASYEPPPVGSDGGNTWRVFEIIATDGELTFSDDGGESLRYFQAGGSQDMTTFARPGSTLVPGKPVLPASVQEALDQPTEDFRQ